MSLPIDVVIRSALPAEAPSVASLLISQLREHAIPVAEAHVTATVGDRLSGMDAVS